LAAEPEELIEKGLVMSIPVRMPFLLGIGSLPTLGRESRMLKKARYRYVLLLILLLSVMMTLSGIKGGGGT
jgi:hypothetical protein